MNVRHRTPPAPAHLEGQHLRGGHTPAHSPLREIRVLGRLLNHRDVGLVGPSGHDSHRVGRTECARSRARLSHRKEKLPMFPRWVAHQVSHTWTKRLSAEPGEGVRLSVLWIESGRQTTGSHRTLNRAGVQTTGGPPGGLSRSPLHRPH